MVDSSATLKVAKRIKAVRQNKGLTQVQVAEKAKINANYYSRIERGEVKPSADMYEAIAKVLKVTASDIFPF